MHKNIADCSNISLSYPILIIPAFNPDRTLVDLLKGHNALNNKQICIVVNDGSDGCFDDIFDEVEQLGKIVLRHKKNQGKGAALKTAMNYYLAHFSEKSPGLITADADGQHRIEDILRLSEALKNEPTKLHLGVRQISKKDIPLRSRLGNSVTKFLFNGLTKNKILDTQTGLRGIPDHLVQHLLRTKTTRYEFEFEMFFIAKKHRIQISQISIQTIYIDGNRSSHFNPLLDSIRIYFIFIRFCFVGITSFVLDFSLFSLFYYCSQHPGFSMIGARIFSMPFNFCMHKKISFKSKNNVLYSAFSYGILALIIVMSSFKLMLVIHAVGLNMYYSKILAEFFIFIINFCMQYAVIFTRKESPLKITL